MEKRKGSEKREREEKIEVKGKRIGGDRKNRKEK